jgi:ABC-type histidine transport system ATPase subunit
MQNTLKTNIDALTKQRNEIENKAKAYLDKIVVDHKQKLQEKQEVQKEVLNFLHQI